MVEKTEKKPEIKPSVKATEAKVAEVKSAAKAEEGKVVETVKEVAKKATQKKTATRKTTAKKETISKEVFVEFYGQQSSLETVETKVKEAFVAEGHKLTTIKSLKMYLKPEEGAVYYVINEKFAGRVELF